MANNAARADETRRVMIIDDDVDFAESLLEILESNGYDVTCLHTKNDVSNLIRENRPQVALIDLRLGQSSGLDLLDLIKEYNPDTLCIMITAYAVIDTAVEALKRGAYDYLRKPVSPDELLATLKRCFQKIELKEEKEAAQEALKYTEQQLIHSQKMEAVGRLAGGIAHDFNNILTIILGFSDLLLAKTADNETIKNDIKQIKNAGLRATGLTRQLLAFSRKHVVTPEVFNVNSVIIELEKMLQRLIGEHMMLELNIPDEPFHLKMDVAYFEQALLNLVINARDAMPQGGSIKITTGKKTLNGNESHLIIPQKGEYISISVEDYGAGIPADILPNIFEPFFTTKESGKGTGLGLSTVFGIVEQEQGAIAVRSEPQNGSAFTLFFREYEGKKTRVKTVQFSGDAGGSESILVVEDEDTLRELIKGTLEEYGYTVYDFGDPSVCIETVAKKNLEYDLIVSDVIMPGMSGPELVERLQAGSSKEKPVLYMSGYTDETISSYGISEKGIRFIHKPFALMDFVKKMRTVIDQHIEETK